MLSLLKGYYIDSDIITISLLQIGDMLYLVDCAIVVARQ